MSQQSSFVVGISPSSLNGATATTTTKGFGPPSSLKNKSRSHAKKSSFHHGVSMEIPPVEESVLEEDLAPLGSPMNGINNDLSRVHPLHRPSTIRTAGSGMHSPSSSSSSSLSSCSFVDVRKSHLRRNSSSSSSAFSGDGSRPPRRRTLSSSSSILIPISDRPKSITRRQSSSSASSILGSDDETLEDLKDSLKIRRQVLGDTHPKVGLSYNQIGNCHFRRSEFTEATKSYTNALNCFKRVVEDTVNVTSETGLSSSGVSSSASDKLAIALTLGNIGAVQWRTGQFDDAVKNLEEAIDIQEQIMQFSGDDCGGGGGGIELSSTLYNLGLVLCLKGDYDASRDVLDRCYELRLEVFGHCHVEVARAMDALGKVYLLKNDAKRAIECHQEALKVKRSAVGGGSARHPAVVISMTNLAAAYNKNGELINATSMYSEVLRAQKSILSSILHHERTVGDANIATASIDIGVTYHMLGEIQLDLGDETAAKRSFREGLEYFREGKLMSTDNRFIALHKAFSNLE